jgi:hypothetical protein
MCNMCWAENCAGAAMITTTIATLLCAVSPHWQPLFNGQDLGGWTIYKHEAFTGTAADPNGDLRCSVVPTFKQELLCCGIYRPTGLWEHDFMGSAYPVAGLAVQYRRTNRCPPSVALEGPENRLWCGHVRPSQLLDHD